MEWIKCSDTTKVPDTEVLAIGFQDECLVGYLRKDKRGDWTCQSDGEWLDEVKGFILIKDIVKSFKQS
jgi:hypothetical protein